MYCANEKYIQVAPCARGLLVLVFAFQEGQESAVQPASLTIKQQRPLLYSVSLLIRDALFLFHAEYLVRQARETELSVISLLKGISPLTLFYLPLRLCSPRHNISPQRSLRQRHRRIAQRPAHRVLGRRCSSSRFLTRKLFARSTYARYQLADPCNLSTRTAIPARSVRANGLPPFSCRRIVRRR